MSATISSPPKSQAGESTFARFGSSESHSEIGFNCRSDRLRFVGVEPGRNVDRKHQRTRPEARSRASFSIDRCSMTFRKTPSSGRFRPVPKSASTMTS